MYKTLLSNVKRDYEIMIDDLEKRQVERSEFLREYEKCTLMRVTAGNLEKRRQELVQRLEEIKAYNNELISKLDILKEENEKYRPKKMNRFTLLTSNMNKEKTTNEEQPVVMVPGI